MARWCSPTSASRTDGCGIEPSGVRNRRAAVALVTAACTALSGATLAVAEDPHVALPTDTQQQYSAARPIPLPTSRSCTEQLMVHDFGNSYGAPFNGTYAPPPACPGPWSKVVLTLTSTVSGTQFDRDVYVAIGHSVVLDGTTSEPCCTGNASTWTVQRDVTDITPSLQTQQPVQVELDNVNDSTYTGVYHTAVSLTFFTSDAKNPPAAHADVVLPVSSAGSGGPMLTINKDGQRVSSAVTFPTDLTRLTAQVFADAHGPCEEFWWDDPGDCAGTPYREVAVWLDGRIAGAAPAYPVTYTGAAGPGLWEPIPSPRAWNLRPYELDLTPFVGTLTDGKAHQVQLGVLDTTLQGGDFWAIAANLLGWRSGRGPTRGGLVSAPGPEAPTDTVTDPAQQGAPYLDSASQALTFVGTTVAAGKTTTTTVREAMGEDDKQALVPDDATWSWNQSSATVTGGHTTVVAQTATYGLMSDLLTYYDLTDNGTTSTTVDGVRTHWTSYADSMRTTDATGIAYNGVEFEQYRYADDTGACYDHVLASQAGEITVDNVDATLCPTAPA